jgi:adenine-specific DNA-methyltransferase
VNKDKALVPNVDLGGYTWVERGDPRLTEVRLLKELDRVGEVGGTASDNLLIQGDSYDALHALTRVPEFESEYHGKVKVVYIDPPFNTGQTFEHYEDGLEHSVWLGMMRERLLLIQELLSDDGTVWVHLDAAEVHRCRILMDEIFGPSNYLSTVVWQRTTAKSLAKRTMGTMHEEILVYGASEKAELQSNFMPLDAKYAAKRFSQVDERGPYDTGDLTAGSYRPHLDSGKPWRGFDPSSRRRCWAVPGGPLGEIGLEPSRTRTMGMLDKLDALDNAGYIHWPDKPGGFPRYKKYLHRAKGIALGDLWNDITVINSQAAERTGFSTQKPEALLKRILTIASRPGDIVVDCFAGSTRRAATCAGWARHASKCRSANRANNPPLWATGNRQSYANSATASGCHTTDRKPFNTAVYGENPANNGANAGNRSSRLATTRPYPPARSCSESPNTPNDSPEVHADTYHRGSANPHNTRPDPTSTNSLPMIPGTTTTASREHGSTTC